MGMGDAFSAGADVTDDSEDSSRISYRTRRQLQVARPSHETFSLLCSSSSIGTKTPSAIKGLRDSGTDLKELVSRYSNSSSLVSSTTIGLDFDPTAASFSPQRQTRFSSSAIFTAFSRLASSRA